MKILYVFRKKDNFESLIEKLKQTDDLNEVAIVLSGIHDRSLFVKIINRLLNDLYEDRQEIKHLTEKLKELKQTIDKCEEII